MPWTPIEQADALAILGMKEGEIYCAYCGSPSATDWDHLRPLVKGGRPTGFVTEIRNLVPACGPCNQSKGSGDWRLWLTGNSKGSRKARGNSGFEQRMNRLAAFEKWGADRDPLVLRDLVSSELWDAHWRNLDEIKSKMQDAQRHAERLQKAISVAVEAQQPTVQKSATRRDTQSAATPAKG
jgi:hypothetical protein